VPTNLEGRVRKAALDYGLFDEAPRAAAWLREQAPAPARVRVVGDDDSDGATSAHVLSTALRRAGYDVDVSLQPVHTDADLDRALAGAFDAWVIADAGSTFLPSIERRGRPVLVVDHHAVTGHRPQHAFELNPRRVGGNETWGVSASVVSLLFALALDARRNWDLAPAAIAGAMSDRQHLGGFHGLAEYAMDGAVRHGVLSRTEGFTLDGPTVLDALTTSLDPYLADFAIDASAARQFLEGLRIAPDADPLALGEDAARRLADELTRRLSRGPGVSERTYPLFGTRLHLPGGRPPTVGALSRLIEAATAEGGHALALALLAGRMEAVEEAEILARRRQERIRAEIQRLRGAVHDRPALRWARTEDAANTGVYSHVLLSYVFGDDRPLLVFAPTPDGLKVSARGSPRLFLAGQDLALALARAASAVGGHGGGHPGAAGAALPADGLEPFLARLEEVLRALAKEVKP
jgi:single-stranded-DNA-specific exonuclease